MYKQDIAEGKFICQQSQRGDSLYVLFKGKLSVHQNDKCIRTIEEGPELFGELAILYDCKRTASILAETNCIVFGIDRSCFKDILIKNNIDRRQNYMDLIRQAFDFESEDHVGKIADVVQLKSYDAGTKIIRQGEKGTTFYIIFKGTVKVIENGTRVNTLQSGQFFGERALFETEETTANVIAEEGGTSCLTINRFDFKQLIGNIPEIKTRISRTDYSNSTNRSSLTDTKLIERISIDKKYKMITLHSLEKRTILGTGAFGTVELVTHKSLPNESFALKSLKKKEIIDKKQKNEVLSERRIMMTSKSCEFIVPVHKTFIDSKYLYLLMEACLGGEVWTHLSKNKDGLGEKATKFTAACVVEAFEYLHGKNIVYRDLKPENLVIDSKGYVKLTDFGFAKKLSKGKKTYTFCGTPEYVSPEVILSKGHDCSADYWALGVLIYELSTGEPPFQGNDPLDIYKTIVDGIQARPMPKILSKPVRDLIFKLCCDEPTDRLGSQVNGIKDIRRHKWFSNFDFWSLRLRSLKVPRVYRKHPNDVVDTSNFQKFEKCADNTPDVLSNDFEEFECDFTNEI